MKKSIYVLIVFVLVLGFSFAWQGSSAMAQDSEPDNMIALGKALFFDPNLSVNGKQSCATCHDPGVGFSGPLSQVNLETAVYPGAIETRYGNRKPPISSYAGNSPNLHYDLALGKWAGGMFWDGRATGNILGDPLAEQAQGPFLNPLEMGMPDARLLAVRVARSEYADLFMEVWGPESLDFAKDVDGVYERIARSIAAYERSSDANPFTSKFDLFWDNATAVGKDVTKIKCGTPGGMGGGGMGGAMMGCPGGGTSPYRWSMYRNLGLSDVELRGLAAFNDPSRANCASCHSLEPGPEGYPLFTNFGYDNLGIPKNPDNPYYTMPAKWNADGENWVDHGLGGYLKSAGETPDVYEQELGKFKIPSLRNVDLRPSDDFVKAYGHNGYFKSLDEIVLFYAWRGLTMNGGLGLGGSGLDCDMRGGGGMGGGDMAMMCDPNLFPQPEVNQNLTPMNHFNMMDQSTIVTFLTTLSDGYFQR